jgi:hypothetical protein
LTTGEIGAHFAEIYGASVTKERLRYSYHEFGGGVWIELVHISFQAELSSWIAETLEAGR